MQIPLNPTTSANVHPLKEVSAPPRLPGMRARHSFASLIHNIHREKVPAPILPRGKGMDTVPGVSLSQGGPRGWSQPPGVTVHTPNPRGALSLGRGTTAPRAARDSPSQGGKSSKSRGNALSQGVPDCTSSPSSSGCSPGSPRPCRREGGKDDQCHHGHQPAQPPLVTVTPSWDRSHPWSPLATHSHSPSSCPELLPQQDTRSQPSFYTGNHPHHIPQG